MIPYTMIFIDLASKAKIQETFCDSELRITSIPIQKQVGVKDCGLFAQAFATFLAFGKKPSALTIPPLV